MSNTHTRAEPISAATLEVIATSLTNDAEVIRGSGTQDGIDLAIASMKERWATQLRDAATAIARQVEAQEIGAAIRTALAGINDQDNHYTAHPIFMVQECVRVWGLDVERFGGDHFAWVHDDENNEVDQDDFNRLEAQFQEDGNNDPEGFRRIGYEDRWQNIMPFFTRSGADRWIESNKHNHRGGLRVYVESAHRNYEWQAVLNALRAPTVCPATTPQTDTKETP